MDSSKVVLSSEEANEDDSFLELAGSNGQKFFRKQILRMNSSFVHPANKAQKITVDKAFAEKLVENFKKGYCPIVQVPRVNDRNQHVEDPSYNMGQVVDLAFDDNGVYSYIRADKDADQIGKTYLGASAMIHLNYEDTETGNRVGPTLLHTALTNRPYIRNLDGFEEVSLSNSENDDNTYIVMLSENENSSGSESDEDESRSSMDRLEELLKELSDVYDIDVEALQKAQKEAAEADTEAEKAAADEKVEEAEAKVEDSKEAVEEAEDKADDESEVKAEEKETVAASASEDESELDTLMAKLSEVLKSADPNLVSLSNSEVSLSDLANGVIELSNNYKTMEGTVQSLNRKSAEADVDEAVRVGKVLPAQRDAMVELKLSNEAMYDALIPENPIVALSNEQGVSINDVGSNGKAVDEVQAEIERITQKFNK